MHSRPPAPDKSNSLEVTAFAFDPDSPRVGPCVDPEGTLAGSDPQNAQEQTAPGGIPTRTASVFDEDGHLGHDSLDSVLEEHLGESSAELDASAIDALRNTPEELFLLRHYSERIAPWYGSFRGS